MRVSLPLKIYKLDYHYIWITPTPQKRLIFLYGGPWSWLDMSKTDSKSCFFVGLSFNSTVIIFILIQLKVVLVQPLNMQRGGNRTHIFCQLIFEKWISSFNKGLSSVFLLQKAILKTAWRSTQKLQTIFSDSFKNQLNLFD